MWLKLLCCTWVVYLIRVLWRRWSYDLHKIPSPPSLPLVGHTLPILFGKAGKLFAMWMRSHLKSLGFPKVMRLELGGETWLVVTDAEYINSTVLSNMSAFPRHGSFKEILRQFAGNDEHSRCFVTELNVTPYVKAVRKIYSRAMQSSQLKKAMPKLNGVLQKMIDVIEAKRHEGPIDFQKLSVQFTLDVIGTVAMDTNLGGLDGSRQIVEKMVETGHEARAIISKPSHVLYCKIFPWSAAARKRARTFKSMAAEWDFLVNEIVNKEDPPEGEMPLWYSFKTLLDPETGKLLTYEDLRVEMAAVVGAGMDTTGHQLGWILAMLATHPGIVDKLLEELKQHGLYGQNARDVTFEDLGELKYLSAVIKEGMRIAHVAVVSAARSMSRDMMVLGYRVPKGTVIVGPSGRAMYSEALWGDPGVVRPERWLSAEDVSNKNVRVFSSGPRDCVGQRLAMLEIRFAIVKLFTKYQFSMDVSFDELLGNTVDGLVMEAKDGVWMHVSPRSNAG